MVDEDGRAPYGVDMRRPEHIELIDHNSFPRRNGIKLRVDDSSKEATSEFISKAKARPLGGKRKQQAALKDNPNKQMRG